MTDPPPPAEKLPYHGPCYICGPDNPGGMGLDWFAVDGRVRSTFRFEESQQGPPNHAHGGAAAAEKMKGRKAFTRSILAGCALRRSPHLNDLKEPTCRSLESASSASVPICPSES